ncbi:hypothetical protein NLM16_34710 [Bradyrhizobium brasilense]|uniref:hypothetical protein n=1 Tax=Bradyrhizobium brasilense TaxID=1419277 RepID=UPI002877B91C|nr:hypothetical protein [Bradyrhizobium brasilense]MCP3419271.1 hypothetical protein [Bradyrhizobium brasilense]
MDKVVQVISAATGGWTYHFGVTAEQTEQVLNAAVGEKIKLNEPGEVLVVWDAKTICHSRPTSGGMKSEELVRSSVLHKQQELIAGRAWSSD